MKFRRHAHNLIRRDVPKAILTTTSPPERDHRRFSLSRLRATCHEGPTGVAVAAATLGCAAPGCWPRGSAARDRHGRPPAPVPTPAATLASARAAASVSLPSSSPTSGDAVSVVPLHHSEVSGASPAAPSHLPIRNFVAQACAERPRKRPPRLRKAETPLGYNTPTRNLAPPPGSVTPARRTMCRDAQRLVATRARRPRTQADLALRKVEKQPFHVPRNDPEGRFLLP